MSDDLALALIALREKSKGNPYSAEIITSTRSLTALRDFRKDKIPYEQTASQEYDRALKDIEDWKKRGVKCLCFTDSRYPPELATIADPPLILFYRGEWGESLCAQSRVAVVGSRNCDGQGIWIAEEIADFVAQSGGCVVSGLALGIDAAAHKGALKAKGSCPTIAVLGNGLPNIQPKANERLGYSILDSGGIIVSQFEPDTPVWPQNFLNRNRIIAGLSKAVVVVQAAKRSGSLTTARAALDAGRDVFAVPGSMLDARHEGTNLLIKEGAMILTAPTDLLEHVTGLEEKAGDKIEVALPKDKHAIVERVKELGTVSINELVSEFSGDSNIHTNLLDLEMHGILMRLPGNRFQAVRGTR